MHLQCQIRHIQDYRRSKKYLLSMCVCVSGGGGSSGSVTLDRLMDKIPFGPKPKIVDLTSDRKLADKVCALHASLYAQCYALATQQIYAQSHAAPMQHVGFTCMYAVHMLSTLSGRGQISESPQLRASWTAACSHSKKKRQPCSKTSPDLLYATTSFTILLYLQKAASMLVVSASFAI